MSEFQKKLVRVEWLALQAAVYLIREAGFDNSYFVSQYHLIGDEGQAPVIAKMGRELYDRQGHAIKWEELRAEDFGLEGEIGDFARQSEDMSRTGAQYFLKRTYEFLVFQRDEKVSYTNVWVSFAKRTEDDDWELVHECVTDHRLSGDARWVVYRPDVKE